MEPTFDLKIYDQLLRFRLFQGLSRTELLQMAGNTKFGFLKEPPGQTVTTEGDTCRHLLLLVSGSLSLVRRSDDGGYSFAESIVAPWNLQIEALFGYQPRYTATCCTQSECHFITLSKDEVLRLLDDFLIIRLNLLNMLSTMAQRRTQQQWRRSPQSLRERFLRFLTAHAVYPAGPKQLNMLMTRLAAELGDSRLNISLMLNELQRQGLLLLHRGRIEIPSLEKLLQL